ncbi:MAG: DUF4097 family beta strand repeat-containing protein [Candidatus Acidiferrales bacterium]
MKLSNWIAAGIALAGISLAAAAPSAHADEWSKTYKVSGHPTLRVETDDGDVSITPGDANQIDARVTTDGIKIGPSDVRIEEHQEGDNVTVSVKLPHFNFSFFGGHHRAVHVDLRVPKDLTLDVHTGDGNVTAQPLSGRIRIDTGDGHITVNGLKGEVSMRSGDGNIQASGLDGSLEVDTGDGHVTVDGRFDSLNLKTGDGNIEARANSGSKVASSWHLHSGDGHINMWLPGDFSADLDAHTGDGKITLDLPIRVSGSLSHSSIHGTLNNGGGTVSVSSGDGSIHLQRL